MKKNFVVNNIINSIKSDISKALEEYKVTPVLVIVRMGDNSSNSSYERSISRLCKENNLIATSNTIDYYKTTEDVLKIINKLNNDNSVDGIMLLLPLPDHIDHDRVVNSISISKDVDCINPTNFRNLFKKEVNGILPCTAQSIYIYVDNLLDSLLGKEVVIVNASNVIGLPLSVMLSKAGATPTVCNSKTNDLKNKIKNADVVIVAIGKANYFDLSYFNSESIIIDAGLSLDDNGNLAGDVDYDNVVDNVKYVNYYRNEVGLLTSYILLRHLLLCTYQKY